MSKIIKNEIPETKKTFSIPALNLTLFLSSSVSFGPPFNFIFYQHAVTSKISRFPPKMGGSTSWCSVKMLFWTFFPN